jgi:ElaB/YqjD/DUF883 family membrane-anchored ribosome-binding protein
MLTKRLHGAKKSVPYSLRGRLIDRPSREIAEMTRTSELTDSSSPNKDNGAATNFHAGTEAAARKAHELIDRAAKLAEDSEQRIREVAANAEHTLQETLETARSKGLGAKESIGDLVQRHPWAAVGIAFGVGILLSTLARRGGDKVD